jgi:hypothetical protein
MVPPPMPNAASFGTMSNGNSARSQYSAQRQSSGQAEKEGRVGLYACAQLHAAPGHTHTTVLCDSGRVLV